MTSLLRLPLLFLCVELCNSINILIFLPGTTPLERAPLEQLAFQLGRRNHKVATFKGIIVPEVKHLVKHRIHGVKEIELKLRLAPEVYQPVEQSGNEAPWRSDYVGIVGGYSLSRWSAYVNACTPILNSDLMDKLRVDPIDVAVVYSENPCYLALVHALSIPYIYMDLTGISDETAAAAGLPFQPAEFPSSQSTFSTEMSLSERMQNTWMLFQEYTDAVPILSSLISSRRQHLDQPITDLFRGDYELRKRFAHFPDMAEIRRRAELYFVNTDPLLEFYRRPLPANVVPVGGFHIDYTKPLYEPWNSTMASAEDGVVVVSLGTRANSSAAPTEFLNALVGAFRRLPKARIFWRVATTTLPSSVAPLPDNVNLTTYLPQNDLLASKYSRVFVTNGGMHSIMEAIAHGVPIVGIPLFGADCHNLRKVEQKGIGIILEKNDITSDNLQAAIRLLLDNPKYKLAAERMQKAFNNRPLSALDVAVYWIEYVGRNHGAKLIKPFRAAFSLPQQFLLDVLLVAIVSVFGVYLLARWLAKFTIRTVDYHSYVPESHKIADITQSEEQTTKKGKTTIK